MTLEQDRLIASSLPRTWSIFFNKYGRLTPVQRASIPSILGGSDCLISAPTASGKTEAVLAPLIESLYQSETNATIIYVCPTRALVNDLYERIRLNLSLLNVSLARRTGDNKDTLSGSGVILTTPESLDSLICRGRIRKGHILSRAQALVIDEVHLLSATPRGEQLKWLIKRLRDLRKFSVTKGIAQTSTLQIVALSATVSDVEVVANKFLKDEKIFRVPGGRKIIKVSVSAETTATEHSIGAYISVLDVSEKVLVFCNTRRRVDALTKGMTPVLNKAGYEVKAHHGSLSQAQRVNTENSIKTAKGIVVFATMTLEVGIDIGDIDLIVLDGPPPDVQSFLQRIGRGNRRTEETRVMLCSGSHLETIIQDAMFKAAEDGWMNKVVEGPHFNVARQQTASHIFQLPQKRTTPGSLAKFMTDGGTQGFTESMLDTFVDNGDLKRTSGYLILGDNWAKRGETGSIHSNIEAPPGYQVVDSSSGEIIATGLSHHQGGGLGIGGISMEVVDWNKQKIEIRKVSEGEVPEGNWGYISRGWLKGSDSAQCLKRYVQIPENCWPVLSVDGKDYIFHFGGSRRKIILDLLYQLSYGESSLQNNEWFLKTSSTQPIIASDATDLLKSTAVDDLIDSRLESLRLSRLFVRWQYLPT